MKKLALLVTLASSAFIANAQDAQDTIGTLQGVSGAVSISGKSIVSRASSGTPVAEGTSILVSSSGKATLVLNNGCSVALGANQHLTVSAKTPCTEVSASVKHLFPAYQVAQAPIGGGVAAMPSGQPSPAAPPAAAFGGMSANSLAVLGLVGGIGVVSAIGASSDDDEPVSGQ